MNGADVDRAVQAISFRAGLSTWKPKITVIHLSGGVTLRVQITVPHCVTGDLTDVQLEDIYDDNELGRMSTEKFILTVHRQLCKLVTHEIYESFLFRGKPYFNAHPGGG